MGRFLLPFVWGKGTSIFQNGDVRFRNNVCVRGSVCVDADVYNTDACTLEISLFWAILVTKYSMWSGDSLCCQCYKSKLINDMEFGWNSVDRKGMGCMERYQAVILGSID